MKKFFTKLFVIYIVIAGNLSHLIAAMGKDTSDFNRNIPTLPHEYGSIIHSLHNNSTNNRTLYIIIDAHSNLSAQYNISNILSFLANHNDIGQIFLEGASGPIDAKQYMVGADETIHHSIASYLLESGYFTGAEYYFALASYPEMLISGAEVNCDYVNNLKQLKMLRQLAVKQIADSLITSLTSALYSEVDSSLRGVDAAYLELVNNGTGALDFACLLHKTFSRHFQEAPKQYETLIRLAYIAENTVTIENTIKHVLKNLKLHHTEPDVSEQAGVLLAYSLLGDSTLKFLVDTGAFFNRHPDLIDGALLVELRKLETELTVFHNTAPDEIYMELLRSYKNLIADNLVDDTLFTTRNQLIGMLKGYSLQLSSEEVTFFDIETFSPSELVRFVARQLSDTAVTSYSATTENIARLAEAKEVMCQFYRSAKLRNESIMQVVYDNTPPDTAAVLIVGGFHKHIATQFAQHGFDVTVIMPQFQSAHSVHVRDISYTEYMSGKFSSLEKLLYYSWSTIVAPLVTQAVSQLPNKQEAIKPLIAKQISLLLGITLTVRRGLDAQYDKQAILHQIDELYRSAEPLTQRMIRDFLDLPGDTAYPSMPRLIDYISVANGQGMVLGVKIDQNSFLIQLLPRGVELTPEEQTIITSATGYSAENVVTLDGQDYSLTLMNVPPIPRFLNDHDPGTALRITRHPIMGLIMTLLFAGDVAMSEQFLSRIGITDIPGISLTQEAAAAESLTIEQRMAQLNTQYNAMLPDLESWIKQQSDAVNGFGLGNSNAQLGVSFRGLWKSYQSTGNPASHHIAQYDRIWPYDSSLGLYSALAAGDVSRAKQAVESFIKIMRAEKEKEYIGLLHFSYNTYGDSYVSPYEPFGNTLWTLKAMYAYMLKTGDLTYYDELTGYVKQAVLPLQIIDRFHPSYGFIRAGYTHSDGINHNGYGVYDDIAALNTINGSMSLEHNADYIDLLRLMALVSMRHSPGAEPEFMQELAKRHALVMQAMKRNRVANHWPTGIDEQGDVNWSRATDHYTWGAATFIGFDEEIAWESVQLLAREFTTTVESIEVVDGTKRREVPLSKPATGLIFFAKDYQDQYVDFTVEERQYLERMIQPEATAGGIVFLHNFVQSTKDEQRKAFALALMEKYVDGLATIHNAYKEIYKGGGMPYATKNFAVFNSTPSMAAGASAFLAGLVLKTGYSYYIGVPAPDSFKDALTATVDTDNLSMAPLKALMPAADQPTESTQPAAPVQGIDTSHVSTQTIDLSGSDDLNDAIHFRHAQVKNGRIVIDIEMPAEQRDKLKIILMVKEDVYYLQPQQINWREFQRDFDIENGEFLLSPQGNRLVPGKTIVLVVDPDQLPWGYDENVTSAMLIEAIEKGWVKERIVAQAKLSRDEISSFDMYRDTLTRAGLLPEDFEALISLTDDQRIVGDLSKLKILARVSGNKYHELLLRAYARELTHIIVHNNQLTEITNRFKNKIGEDRFKRMKSDVARFWDIQFRDDHHFMDELIDFYMDAKFSKNNIGFFDSPDFEGINAALQYALGADIFSALYFNPIGGEFGSQTYLDAKVEHVQQLAGLARFHGKDIDIFSKGTTTVELSDPISTLLKYANNNKLLDSSL